MPEEWKYQRDLPHIQRVGATYFVTYCVRKGLTLSPQERDVALDCCMHIHERSAILHGAVVMPDHVHLILTPLVDETGAPRRLDRIMQGIKGTSARRINKLSDRRGPIWQSESFDHVLRRYESAEAKTSYICENPVRKGLVAKSGEYKWVWRLGDGR